MLKIKNELDVKIAEMHDDNQNHQKKTLNARAAQLKGLHITIEANERDIALLHARINANNTIFADL